MKHIYAFTSKIFFTFSLFLQTINVMATTNPILLSTYSPPFVSFGIEHESCDYIRHPRPHRFLRAMKQIYQPSYVLSHFVHYSAVTVDTAMYYDEHVRTNRDPYPQSMQPESKHEHVLNELSEGVLIHTKTVLPQETITRTKFCTNSSRGVCMIGLVCPSSTPFDDASHTRNIFTDENGKYCNCWIDENIDNYWIPLLEEALRKHTK